MVGVPPESRVVFLSVASSCDGDRSQGGRGDHHWESCVRSLCCKEGKNRGTGAGLERERSMLGKRWILNEGRKNWRGEGW